jgi:hypothetical protein
MRSPSVRAREKAPSPASQIFWAESATAWPTLLSSTARARLRVRDVLRATMSVSFLSGNGIACSASIGRSSRAATG